MTRARRHLALGAALSTLAGLGLTVPASADPVPATPAGSHPVVLPEPPADQTDASLRLGLSAYHDIAPRLNAVQASSDRVSTEVIGTSTQGRDIVMVTVTAPEIPAQARQQTRMRERITGQPAQAARDRALARNYKLPVFVNANIHGNEWEGADAALRLVEELAGSQDPAVAELLSGVRVHLVISGNPDGRVEGTRRNAAGFDLNRDLITATQPETVALRDALVATQPVLMLDLHGYVNGTLVEPTTAPHGENYEYDLFVRHAYPNGLGMEERIDALGYGQDDGVRPVQIPLRDWDEGWDDWPPIFAPQYAALHGAVAHTIEVPLRVNNASYDLPEDELGRRAAINTDIAHAAMGATLDYAVDHREDLLADHIEVFRRGRAGEPQTPVTEGLFGVIGPEDVYPTRYPRAYVVPAGEAQRSAPAAARLVDHLLANDVEVTRLSRDTTVAGRTYPQGSYVVDLHQAKRGVANAVLGRGSDISERVDAMYDISGWSHGLLWGADVVTVPEGDPLRLSGHPVDAADPSGALPDSGTGWVLRLDDPADVAALNTLLGQGVRVQWLTDGTVLVPAGSPWAAGHVVEQHGVVLEPAAADAAGADLRALRVGVAGTPEEQYALTRMGFTVQPISTDTLNAGLDLSTLDALYVSADLSWSDLDASAREQVTDLVSGGGGLVGRGPAGAAVNEALDLLEVTAVRGRSDGNGVVSVTADDGSPIAGGAPDHTFVYGPMWFTDLGADVRADQRYADQPLVSGHWRATPSGSGGPDRAAGEAVVVSGPAGDSRAVLFGSEPLFRAHPQGQFALVARSLLWSSLED